MNAYTSAQLVADTLSPSDIAALASLLDSGGLASMTSLDGLPSAVQSVVRNAFLDGVEWSFVSLLPWLGIGCVVSLFLSRIEDPDKEGRGGGVKPRTGGDVEARAAR